VSTPLEPRRIAVVPAFNEEPTVVAVLDELYPMVDELVVVDDGSTDGTRAAVEAWMAGRDRCTLLCHDVNQGMSEAYALALTLLRARLANGELHPNDLVFTVDADGQHDLTVLDELVKMTLAEGLDANLARRDLSYHHAYKRAGNWMLSRWASWWAGARMHDVESGYRIFRLGALAHALDFYSGYKYSETVEVAVVLSRLGYRVRNDHLVPVPVSRSRTRLRDAVIDMRVIPAAATRVWRAEGYRPSLAGDAAAHLAVCGVLALLLAVSISRQTSGFATLSLAALAAFGAAMLMRRAVPRPSLALLGPIVAAAAAFLIPQRNDMGSAIVLAAVFTAGVALAAPAVRRPRPAVVGTALVALLALRFADARTALLLVAVVVVGLAALAARLRRVPIPRTQRWRTVAVGSGLMVTTLGLTGYFGATTVGATWFGGGVTHGPRQSNEVAITFDDGPNVGATPAVMRILDRAGVKGTFFIVGKALDQDPQIVRALYAHGHLLGNHSYHHDQWRWLDPRYPELERTQSAFAQDVGACPAWFRPPHGDRTPMMARVVHQHGMRMAMWDVSAGDWATTSAHTIADRVLNRVRGGSIIDLHDGLDGKPYVDRSVIVRALPLILDGLRARHLRPVRLDELVGGPAYAPCNAKTA
jgi:peptidoglycan/xylan/chitin deacetylase (PgdA/CDA1 family)